MRNRLSPAFPALIQCAAATETPPPMRVSPVQPRIQLEYQAGRAPDDGRVKAAIFSSLAEAVEARAFLIYSPAGRLDRSAQRGRCFCSLCGGDRQASDAIEKISRNYLKRAFAQTCSSFCAAPICRMRIIFRRSAL